MLRPLLILFSLLLNAVHLAAQSGFQQLYGGHNQEISVFAIPSSGNGIYYLGATTSAGAGDADLTLMKVDNNGQVIWAKTYGSIYWDSPDYMASAADGGLVVVGTSKSFSGNQSNSLMFFKTDSMGNIVWSKTFLLGTGTNATTIIRTADNGFAITGFSKVGSYGRVLLIRTNASGNTLFARSYGSGLADDLGVGITQTADGGFIISGKTWTNTIGHADVLLLKVDSAGNIHWTKSYGGPGWEEGEAIAVAQDSSYLVCGATNTYGQGDYDILLMKYDTAGGLLWGKTYGGNREDASYSVIENSDGSIVLSGYTNSMGFGHALSLKDNSENSLRLQPQLPDVLGDDSSNAFLLKTDAAGDTIWTQVYGHGKQDEAFHFSAMPDGGYIIPSLSNSYTYLTDSIQMLLIRTDSLGYSGCHQQRARPIIGNANYVSQNLPFTQTAGFTVNNITLISQPWNILADDACLYLSVNSLVEKESISVFPNPTDKEIHIRFPDRDISSIELLNMQGQLLIRKDVSKSGEEIIEVKSLSDGAYILHITTQNRIITRKVIIAKTK